MPANNRSLLILSRLDYFLKNKSIRILILLLFKKYKKGAISNILIFRNGSLGDSVCALPAIYNIRKNFPQANITILHNNGLANLASIENIVDKGTINDFINYRDLPVKELRKTIKQKKIDLLIELPQVHQPFSSHIRNMFFIRSLGIKHAFGWKIQATRLFPRVQEKFVAFQNVRNHLLGILQNNGLVIYEEDRFPMAIGSQEIDAVDQRFAENGLTENAPVVAVIVGAKRPQNRWPLNYFDRVVGHLLGKGYHCVLIGGAEDTELARQLKNYREVVDFTGQLTPLESAEAMKRCKLVVTNDTGPMHLAYATGTFVVALFSSRDYPGLWYPPANRSYIFRNHEVHCKTCFSETCTINICMHQIRPETVISKIDELLPDVK
jgi:ADP-heptose:LPS heptosyltransferase